jgi:hypothetical protein
MERRSGRGENKITFTDLPFSGSLIASTCVNLTFGHYGSRPETKTYRPGLCKDVTIADS